MYRGEDLNAAMRLSRPASVFHRKPNLVHTVHMHFKNNNIVNRYHA